MHVGEATRAWSTVRFHPEAKRRLGELAPYADDNVHIAWYDPSERPVGGGYLTTPLCLRKKYSGRIGWTLEVARYDEPVTCLMCIALESP